MTTVHAENKAVEVDFVVGAVLGSGGFGLVKDGVSGRRELSKLPCCTVLLYIVTDGANPPGTGFSFLGGNITHFSTTGRAGTKGLDEIFPTGFILGACTGTYPSHCGKKRTRKSNQPKGGGVAVLYVPYSIIDKDRSYRKEQARS